MKILVPTSGGEVRIEESHEKRVHVRFGPSGSQRSNMAYFTASEARHFAYLLMAAAEEKDSKHYVV